MTNTTQDIAENCIDYSGRRVHLTQRFADHIRIRHPEMISFLQYICDVLMAPDFVYLRSRVNTHLYYKLGILTGKLSNTYMVVIVRYNDDGDGEVRTVYPTTRPASRDTLLSIRPKGS